jgi:uncharacterized protein YydD (DUF2326 family)
MINLKSKYLSTFAKVFKHVDGNSLTFPSSIFLAHKSLFLLTKKFFYSFPRGELDKSEREIAELNAKMKKIVEDFNKKNK